jgi:hypothetical protein
VDEYRELDAHRVLAFLHHTGRGKSSGLELGQMQSKAAVLFHACDGKASRLVLYWDRENALTDLGLAE